MSKKKYRTGIIGTGRIGYLLQKDKLREQPASHSKAFSKNKRIKIIAACDTDTERLKMWKKDYNKNIYEDYNLMLEKEKLDIIIISVDEKNHLETTLKALEYKPLLIVLEKPVAPDMDNALKILKTSEKYNVPVCINHERRFSKDYLKVKKILKNQLAGEIHSIHAKLWSNTIVWHDKCHEHGDCLLIHDGTHLIDIIHFLFECTINDISVDFFTKNNENKISSVYLHSVISKNTYLHIEMCGNKKYFGFELEIRGSKGTILIGNGYLKVYLSKKSPYYKNFRSLILDKKIRRPDKTKYFSNMVNNCVDFLDNKSELISPIDEGIKTFEVLYKISEILGKNS